jgi:hypothetical protein
MTSSQQRIAEEIVGAVDWRSSSYGWGVCPGRHLHTTPSGPRDCRVRVEKEDGIAPGVYCFHANCSAIVTQASTELRSSLAKMEIATGVAPRVFVPSPPPPPEPVFSLEVFKKYAASVSDEIDSDWLTMRSPICPWNRTPASFLHSLYRPGEKVLIFDEYKSQGQAVWTHPGFPYDAYALDCFTKGAKAGVWFLTSPIDGEYYLKDDCSSRSRRSERSITSWRHLVVESDKPDISPQDWLKVLVQLPLRIIAIYETGGNLPHALVRLSESKSKDEWDYQRDQLLPSLVMLGADPKTMSAVRLSRLPQCERLGKFDRDGKYHAFDKRRVQKLLYLNPPRDYLPGYLDPWADERPIIEKPVVCKNLQGNPTEPSSVEDTEPL